MPASLETLEAAAARRDGGAALLAALEILRAVDDRYGLLDTVAGAGPSQPLLRSATRFCAAFGEALCDPATELDAALYEQLVAHHRWIELMFAASGFGSADHLLARLAPAEGSGRRAPPHNLRRLFLIFSAAAGMKLDPDEALRADAPAAIAGFLSFLGSRFCFTEGAQALRERLLEWLPERLAQVQLGGLALRNCASPYMHCSYATGPHKHAIKPAIIAQMRGALLAAGAGEWSPADPPASEPKPTVVVSTEGFSFGHSVFRTHSRSVEALKRSFHVVGLMHREQMSPPVEACFDELIAYPEGGTFQEIVAETAALVLARRPVLVLHLGVGMSAIVIGLASLRLAPVQAASFGHTATTGSQMIDRMVLPDDFVGDPACFGEALTLLPPAAMPYRRRDDVDYAAIRARAETGGRVGGPLRVAVPASVMKLTPPFFDALARCAASAPMTFEVFPLGGLGLGHAELVRRLAAVLPQATVHPEAPYAAYIERLAACDAFVCPFPYGNMNSIVDAALVGLPGVCLDGPEAHAHADAAYFKRLRLPSELTTASIGAYVGAVTRLALEPDWLATCRAAARDADLNAALFEGDPDLFVHAIEQMLAG